MPVPVHQAENILDAIEYAYQQGWTDGLPIIPPTESRVSGMLAMWDRAPDETVGRVVERHRVITVQQIAANTVMAGCKDEMFPVVLAAVKAILDDRFNIVGPSASTGGAAPLVLVHGPVIERLGFNPDTAVLGAGNRANLTVGRALNLVIRNAVGSIPGDLDQATTGHPGRIAFCLPEGETGGWPALGTELGVADGVSAVTVFAAEAPHSIAEHASEDPESLLSAFARVARATNYSGAVVVVVICPEHRAVFQRAGWSVGDIRSALFEATKTIGDELKHTGRHIGTKTTDEVTLVPSVENIWVVCAGGRAGGHSAIIPPWLGSGRGKGSRPVTVNIKD